MAEGVPGLAGAGARVGLGWRPHLAALALDDGVDFVEVVAENVAPGAAIPDGLALVRARGRPVVPHGVDLSLGGAAEPDPARLAHLADLAVRLDAPLVSEHLAFTRAGPWRAGHLLPVPHTRAAAAVLAANVRRAADALPVPLALEPVAALVRWPEDELSEAEFATAVLEQTDAWLLLDLANLFTNSRNHGFDPFAELARYPLERVAYVHVAGGRVHGGLHHDTHTAALWPEIPDLLAALWSVVPHVPVLLERDDDPRSAQPGAAVVHPGELAAELQALRLVAPGARTVGARASVGVGRGRGAAGEGAASGGRGRPPGAAAPTGTGGPADRDALAGREAALLGTLVAGAAEPAGFDAGRLAAVRAVLGAKRAAAVRRARPDLADRLGGEFEVAFADWARRHPPRVAGTGAGDAAAFAGSLRWRRRPGGRRRAGRV